ncbi:hypothetical protein F2Q69_00044092 [Brassica cretica]|uniref:Agenet domain-containing protein n=1 Tax=Brassica cretica TaxID=69181 RepID=A0A8S9N8X3_BRACR|nr:hypothetical protein F2Q69_00044092 [Brassica cretica]
MHGLMSYRRFGRARSLLSDRAEWAFGRYVAILLEFLSDDSSLFRKGFRKEESISKKYLSKKFPTFFFFGDLDVNFVVLSQHMFRTWKSSPPRDLCIEYSLNDFVEVVVTHGWRKGRVTEILIENNYKVYFNATKEDVVFIYTEIRLSMEWLGGGSWIRGHKREFENNAATPNRSTQESLSKTLVLESNEDDTVNDDATEIKSSRESHSNISVLEATEAETQNHETVDGVELPLPHESDDMMDDVATTIIDPQEIPQETKSLTIEEVNRFDKIEKVDVKCILGDPELHSDLVEDVDSEFGRVVDLVKRGYRLKRQDWLNGSVDMAVVEAEVDENNSSPGIYATDQEKIEFLTKKVVSLEEKVKYLEGLLNICGETLKRKKKGVRPPREVDHQVEDDTEVEHGAKESDTTKVNEGQAQEEEEHQVEDDADVDVGAKGNENSETNEDGEVNEDASKKPREDVDSEFGRVVDLVKRGYRLKRQDWLNGSVDIAVAEAEVDENNSAPGIDATDQEKIELLTKKVNGHNADYEVGDIEVLQNYIDAKRQKIAKGKKNGVRPPREVDHQEEDDTEVEYMAKKSDTSKVNEEQPQEEEEHQEEDDIEVDVDDSAKGNENSETNKDGEVNEDASKNPVKVTKKRGRGNKEKKKSVKPPREVQQQVEDDAEIGAKESENSETNEVDVKCILGDPELHSDLVEDVDSEFGRVVDLVKRGYRLKRQDWLNGSVDIAVAEAEVDENNYAPGIDATDQEKIELLTKKVVSLEEKVKYLEGLLNIRRETLKNADYEVDDTKVLQNYIDAKRQEITKEKKNGVRPPREVDHQEEDDTEVEYGAKKSDTSKEQPEEEEEHQEEDDTEVDVDDSAKGNENSETNKEKKKSVKHPREVQQQVEDDAEIGAKGSEKSETNEDGEVNKDAFKKIVKAIKKRGRGNKGMKKGVTPPT